MRACVPLTYDIGACDVCPKTFTWYFFIRDTGYTVLCGVAVGWILEKAAVKIPGSITPVHCTTWCCGLWVDIREGRGQDPRIYTRPLNSRPLVVIYWALGVRPIATLQVL